jgi:hypothetical protein
LKITEEETKKILNELIDEGVIEESSFASGYYVNK